MAEEKIRVYLRIAKEAVLAAGEFLLGSRKSARKINSEFGRDIKIDADVQSEQIILDYLRKQSNFSILSEESGLIKRDNQDFTWIVDPLDGSLNYTRGIPLCCISIGFWQEENPVFGVVYEFNRAELFSGIVGKGAWLNGQPLKVSKIARKEKAVLCTGFPVGTDFTPEGIRMFIEWVRSYKKIRMVGSAALSITYVASGRADVYQEKDIMFWDIAGGIPILLGAGGQFNMEKATKAHSFHVVASNGTLKHIL